MGNRILVDVRFERGAMAPSELRAVGAAVTNVSVPYRTVTAAVRPERLRAVAGVAGVAAVTEVLTPLTSASDGAGAVTSAIVECNGAATSEGDTHLNALEARQTFEVDGTGSTVGILSDSFDTDESAATDATDDVASGDLPGPGNPCGRTDPVAVLEDLNYQGDADEGRGMAQIVHDLAPGAKLAFATAFTGELEFAENIERLAKPVAEGGADADVIVDDIIYFFEPFFQEGPIAVAADNVTAGGAAFFSAAGNDNLIDASGNDIASWEAPSFRDSASCPPDLGASAERERCMDFDPTGATDNTFGITVEAGWTLTVDLQWAEPRNGVTTDIDAVLLDSSGKVLKAQGLPVGGFENNPGGSQQPVEVFQWTNNKSTQTVQLAILRCFGSCNPGASSATAPRLKFILLQNGGGVSATEYPESSGGDVVGPTIFGHSAAESAIGAGAVAYDTTSEPEYYSSRGPVAHYFGPVESASPAPLLEPAQTLAKPDLVATDGGANTFFGSLVSGTWRFFGTSAAAPHGAAVAALMRDAEPGATPAELRSALAATARPVGAFGPDAIGAGLIDAKEAVGEFAEEPPPDETPPDTSIDSGPEGPTNDPTPTFEFSSTEAGSTFQCRVDEGAFASCTSPHTTAALSDGPHTFEVRAKDPAENTDPTPASRAFTVDTEAPNTQIDSGPSGPTNDSTPTFSFSSPDETAIFECRVDEEAFTSCSSPHTTASLSNGPHSFEVRAKDPAGNTDPSPASRGFTVDTEAPNTLIVSGPEGPTNDTTPTFTFSSTESGSTFECRLDEVGSFTPCTSPHTTEALSDGPHTFEVRAKDPAGNTDPSPASRGFTVDTEAPAGPTLLATTPASPANHNEPLLSGEAEVGSTVRLYEAPSTSDCTEPNLAATGSAANFESPGLAVSVPDNSTTIFRARASDAAGNSSACSTSSITYTEDSQAPNTQIDSGPSGPTNDATPTFSFSSPDETAIFECRVDEEAFTSCSSPHTTAALSDGPHTFEVRAKDPAGNTDPSPASRSFTVDTEAPNTLIVSGPAGPTNDATPTFEFSSPDESASFECRRDEEGAFTACTSPHTTDPLLDGPHTFEVRAKDPAGNTDPSPASRSFTVDTEAPNTQIDSG
ncbi:MAG TPA: Ig-like domain-containing protein, partial [Solirubrobacterales bacterium]